MYTCTYLCKYYYYCRCLVLQVGSDVILEGMVDDDTSYDFCMCNPPFYQDIVEREGDGSYRTGACPSPLNSSASRMADHETITEGGEVQFVSRILMDSLKLRTRIRCVDVCVWLFTYDY